MVTVTALGGAGCVPQWRDPCWRTPLGPEDRMSESGEGPPCDVIG